MPTQEELIDIVKNKYKSIETILQNIPEGCEDSLRPTLEACVKLFWKVKYGKEPIWANGYKEEFNLNEAIKSEKFSRFFSPLMISDMHTIRLLGNKTLHSDGSKKLTASELRDLFERLGKIIKEMEQVLGLHILEPVVAGKAGNSDDSQKEDLLRQNVKHSRFGVGKIISIKEDKIKVIFGVIIHEFPYPQSLKDGTLDLVQYRICPKCGINWIKKEQAMCSICKRLPPPPLPVAPILQRTSVRVGDNFYAKNHADFLNQILRTQYRAYFKSAIKLADGKLLWMIDLGPYISQTGWINQLVSKDRIVEKHNGLAFEGGHTTYKYAIETGAFFDDSDRVIFDIEKGKTERRYIFRGVFHLNKTESSLYENVWDLIKEEYTVQKK